MMKEISRPKTVLVPFGYPGYPQELLDRFTRESEVTIKNLGIDLITAPMVKNIQDVSKARKTLREYEYDFIIVLVLSWIEAPQVIATLKEYFHKPIFLWSHTTFRENGEKLTLGSLPGAAVVRETLEEIDAKLKFVWGMPDEEKVKEELGCFARVSHALRQLSYSRIGLLGYLSMGMYTGAFDHLSIRRNLGPEIDQIDQYVLIKKIGDIKSTKVEELKKKVQKEWDIGRAVTDQDLEITLKMYLALKDLVEEFEWAALTIKCQYELSKYYKHTPCVPISMLADELPCSCEGDIPLIVTQLMMRYLSDQTVSYGDVHTIEGDKVLLGACGYAPLSLGEGRPRVDKTTVLYEGLANCTVYREGKVTLARLSYTKDRGYKMHIATGQAHKPEPFREVGCLPYPSMEVDLDGSGEDFGQNIMSQHYSIVYGHLKTELIELCKLLNIKPVVV